MSRGMEYKWIKFKRRVEQFWCKHEWRRSRFVGLYAGATAPLVCDKCGKQVYDREEPPQ